MKPNTMFELTVDDVDIIENSLRHQLSRLSERRLTHIQSTVIAETLLDSVKEIDAEIREITDLLGRIHNQKNWYRPKKEIYVSG